MQNKAYQEEIDWLFQQFPSYQLVGQSAYKPDLTNCIQLSSLFDNPHLDQKFIHIAGTNGKGSTTSMLSSILTESGYKTGLFTSPHIHDFRERIRINGEVVDEKFVIDFCQKIKSLKIDFSPSFFEITWVMALVYFKLKKCNIIVVETGLGGRLDATNIITPIVSVITNIGLEHTNFLGDTLEKIAFEKGGIIKSTTPIIIGESLKETKPVFLEIATKRDAQLILAENISVPQEISIPLLGEYQKRNFRTVFTTLLELKKIGYSINDENIQKGLENLEVNTGFKARLQVIDKKPLTIIDVSHNYDGIKNTLESIKETNKGKLHLVYGTSGDKDLKKIFSIFPTENTYYFTEFSNARTANIENLKSEAEKNKLNSFFFQDVKTALKTAQKTANEEDTILIFGSFFLIDDIF